MIQRIIAKFFKKTKQETRAMSLDEMLDFNLAAGYLAVTPANGVRW